MVGALCHYQLTSLLLVTITRQQYNDLNMSPHQTRVLSATSHNGTENICFMILMEQIFIVHDLCLKKYNEQTMFSLCVER